MQTNYPHPNPILCDPTGIECDIALDLGFIIDSSGSIGESNWNKMMRLLMSLTSTLNVRKGRAHVGAVTFDTEARMEFDFNAGKDTDEVNDKFARMIRHGGNTYTDEGIMLANERLFSYVHGMRAQATKVGGDGDEI